MGSNVTSTAIMTDYATTTGGVFLQLPADGSGTAAAIQDIIATCGSDEVTVSLDVKPESCPNPLSNKDRGIIPVAILGTDTFDVSDVDVSTALLEGVSPKRSALEDVATPYTNGISDPPDRNDCNTDGADGYTDLVLHFDAQDVFAAVSPADGDVVVVTLTGNLLDGTPIVGVDVMWGVVNNTP